MTFDKQASLRAFRPRVHAITVEHEGVKAEFFARQLSAGDMFDLQEKRTAEKWTNQDFSVHLLVAALCDEKGKPVYNKEEVEELVGWQYEAFNKLATRVADVVGLKRAAEQAAATTGDGAVAAPNA